MTDKIEVPRELLDDVLGMLNRAYYNSPNIRQLDALLREAAQPAHSVNSADELIAVIRNWLEQDSPAHYGDFEKRLAAIVDESRTPADEELRRDAERWHWHVQRYGSPPDKGWSIWAGCYPAQCTGRAHIACLGDGDEAENLARHLCDVHNAAIAAEQERER